MSYRLHHLLNRFRLIRIYSFKLTLFGVVNVTILLKQQKLSTTRNQLIKQKRKYKQDHGNQTTQEWPGRHRVAWREGGSRQTKHNTNTDLRKCKCKWSLVDIFSCTTGFFISYNRRYTAIYQHIMGVGGLTDMVVFHHSCLLYLSIAIIAINYQQICITYILLFVCLGFFPDHVV